jgi:hypothetical protein
LYHSLWKQVIHAEFWSENHKGVNSRYSAVVGRPRRRWIDNTKMDLLEIGVSVVDWIGLAQDRYRWRPLVNAVMNLQVP